MATGDAHWVSQALAGSEDGYRRLMELYQRPVFSVIVRMVRDAGLAEDLTQEAFVKAFRALASFDRKRKFSSWLFAIAHNTAIDYLRRKRLKTVSLDAEREDDAEVRRLENTAVSEQPSPEDVLSHRELGRTLEDALGTLRPEYAEVMLLRFQQGRSYEEIAEIVGLPLGTVKTHLFRARKQLAKLLEAKGWNPGQAGRKRL